MRGGGLREGDEGSVKALELHEGCKVSVRDGRLSSGEWGRRSGLVKYGVPWHRNLGPAPLALAAPGQPRG